MNEENPFEDMTPDEARDCYNHVLFTLLWLIGRTAQKQESPGNEVCRGLASEAPEPYMKQVLSNIATGWDATGKPWWRG